MPIFKKRTEEEKQARREEQSEKDRQILLKNRSEALESKVFPTINDEKIVEVIRNLDKDLSLVHGGFRTSTHVRGFPFELESILKIEHLLKDTEILLGFVFGDDFRTDRNGNSHMQLLVITNSRIMFIREGKTKVKSISYSELDSVAFKSVKGILLSMAEGELTFYIDSKIHKFIGQRVKSIEKAHQVINETKVIFMANPANFEKTNTSTPVAIVQDEKSVTEQLNELKQLLYSRTITQEQYDTMKAKITGK